jgi:hypothetical protein
VPDEPGSFSAPATTVAPTSGTASSPTSPSRCQSPAGSVVWWTGKSAAAPASTLSVSMPSPATRRSTSSAAASRP